MGGRARTRVSGRNKFHPEHFPFIKVPFLVSELHSKHVCIRKALKWKNDKGLPWRSSGQDSASSAGDACSIPGQGTKYPHVVWHGRKKKRTRKEKVWVVATTGRFDKRPDF